MEKSGCNDARPGATERAIMSTLFISHSSKENDEALALHAKLAKEWGFQNVFLDFHEVDGIAAGKEWEQELYRRLRLCQGIVVLCSKNSLASPWCFAEIAQAQGSGQGNVPRRNLALRGTRGVSETASSSG